MRWCCSWSECHVLPNFESLSLPKLHARANAHGERLACAQTCHACCRNLKTAGAGAQDRPRPCMRGGKRGLRRAAQSRAPFVLLVVFMLCIGSCGADEGVGGHPVVGWPELQCSAETEPNRDCPKQRCLLTAHAVGLNTPHDGAMYASGKTDATVAGACCPVSPVAHCAIPCYAAHSACNCNACARMQASTSVHTMPEARCILQDPKLKPCKVTHRHAVTAPYNTSQPLARIARHNCKPAGCKHERRREGAEKCRCGPSPPDIGAKLAAGPRTATMARAMSAKWTTRAEGVKEALDPLKEAHSGLKLPKLTDELLLLTASPGRPPLFADDLSRVDLGALGSRPGIHVRIGKTPTAAAPMYAVAWHASPCMGTCIRHHCPNVGEGAEQVPTTGDDQAKVAAASSNLLEGMLTQTMGIPPAPRPQAPRTAQHDHRGQGSSVQLNAAAAPAPQRSGAPMPGSHQGGAAAGHGGHRVHQWVPQQVRTHTQGTLSNAHCVEVPSHTTHTADHPFWPGLLAGWNGRATGEAPCHVRGRPGASGGQALELLTCPVRTCLSGTAKDQATPHDWCNWSPRAQQPQLGGLGGKCAAATPTTPGCMVDTTCTTLVMVPILGALYKAATLWNCCQLQASRGRRKHCKRAICCYIALKVVVLRHSASYAPTAKISRQTRYFLGKKAAPSILLWRIMSRHSDIIHTWSAKNLNSKAKCSPLHTRTTPCGGLGEAATATASPVEHMHIDTPYWERQRMKFCMVHALNAYAQNSWIKPENVLQYAEHLNQRFLQNNNNQRRLEGMYYNARCGNFTLSMMDMYLARNASALGGAYHHAYISHEGSYQPANSSLLTVQQHQLEETYHEGILPGSSKDQVLSRLPPGGGSVLLHCLKLSPGGRPYGHASCLHLHQGQWWHLDSEFCDAKPLETDQEWAAIYGKMYVLAPGPAPRIATDLLDAEAGAAHATADALMLEAGEAARAAAAATIMDCDTQVSDLECADGQSPTARTDLSAGGAAHGTDHTRRHKPVRSAPCRKAQKTNGTAQGAIRKPAQSRRIAPACNHKQLLIASFFTRKAASVNSPTEAILGPAPQPEGAANPTSAAPTPAAAASPNPRATGTEGPEALPCPLSRPTVTIMTLNTRGMRSNLDVVTAAVGDCDPDILVLTETKLTSNMHRNQTGKRIRHALLPFQLTMSSKPPRQPDGGALHAQAGVVLGVRHEIAALCAPAYAPVPASLGGHISHITLHAPGQTRSHFVGIYMPEVRDTRVSIYQYLRKVADRARANKEIMVVAGDWNAVLSTHDRMSGALDADDLLHQRMCNEIGIRPLCPEPNRAHTYFKPWANTPCSSRIDDVLILSQEAHQGATESMYEPGSSLDHKAIVVRCPAQALHLVRRPDPHGRVALPPTEPTLKYPVAAAQLAATRARIESELTPRHFTTRAAVTAAADQLVEALRGDYAASNVRAVRTRLAASDNLPDVDALAAALQHDLESAYKIMLQVCDQQQPRRTTRGFFGRSQGREYQKLLQQTRELKQVLHTMRDTVGLLDLDGERYSSLTADLRKCADLAAAQARLQSEIKSRVDKMADMRLGKAKKDKAAAHAAFQTRVANQPKQAYRTIFQEPSCDPGAPPLSGLRDMESNQPNIVHNDPTHRLDIAGRFFSKLFDPKPLAGSGHYHGGYLPTERPPGFRYPWQHPASPDTFDLCSTAWVEVVDGATEEGHRPADPEAADLLALLMDRCVYQSVLKQTSRGKQPGPDRIPNELLKNLPDEWHDTIHALFTVMWITGRTPEAWTTSSTILLHKKGDVYDIGNYRPIGLANSLYKLWTSNVTHVVMHHCILHSILHDGQEGGLTGRSTHRQLRTLTSAFEDAYWCKQDIYCLYIDFSSAFNMVDHTKLLCLMYDQGVPSDAIEVIKGIYQESRTAVVLPCGTTPPIPITRGTIQGDPLSPLLFLLYINPMMRWLQVGGRGYQFGCLGDSLDPTTGAPLRLIHHLACCGFIDDTTLLTGDRQQMEVQARKVQAYAEWAGTPVNASKCAVTAALHGQAKRPLHGDAFKPERITAVLGGSRALSIGGKPIPVLQPDEPYKYLGVWCCPAMDWQTQLRGALKDVGELGKKLATSLASERQKLEALQRSIKPRVAYALSVAPYTMADIAALDKALASVARSCLRLPRSYPTSAILRDRQEGGWGVHSFAVDYAQISATMLTRALEDKSRLGLVSKALLDLQRSLMGGAPVEELAEGSTRFCTSLRQLAVMARHGLSLWLPRSAEPYAETPDGTNNNHLWGLTSLLRAELVGPGLLYPLHSLGVKHVGQLVNHDGTEIITTDDLGRLYGNNAGKRQKVALNRLSAAISGHLPPGITQVGKISGTQALPLLCRTIPAALRERLAHDRPSGAHPRAVLGTYDIRALLEQPARPLVQGQVKLNLIHRGTLQRPLSELRMAATAAACTQNEVTVGANHTLPSRVKPSDLTSVQLFWEQRLALAKQCRMPPQSWSATGMTARSATWQGFRDAILQGHLLCTEVVASLYDEQFELAAVTGFRSYRERKHQATKKQYKVRWQPTVMCASHVQAAATCYSCKANPTPLRIADEDTRRLLTQCAPFLADNTGQFLLPMVQVEWEETYMNQADLARSYPDTFPALRSAFEAEGAGAPALQVVPPGLGRELPPQVQQGLRGRAGISPNLSWEAVRRVRQKVILDPIECNPDLDIVPPKTYCIQVGMRRATHEPTHLETAFVYRPDGRCAGTLSIGVLKALHYQYETTRTQCCGNHKGATTFAQDVAGLLQRYRAQKDHHGDAITRAANRWIMPEPVMQAIGQALGSASERFASPLDRSAHFPQYWSAYEQDRIFGANHDAFSHPWTGPSQAYPGRDGPMLEKAMRWAISSALLCPDEATCTVVVMPDVNGYPHLQYLKHPSVTILACLLPRHLQSKAPLLNPPMVWAGAQSPMGDAPTSARPRDTLYIAAVCNAAGAARYLPALRTHLAGASLNPTDKDGAFLPPPPQVVKPPRALERVMQAGQGSFTPTLCPLISLPLSEQLTQRLLCLRPLCAEEGVLSAFTDGSCIKHKDGKQSIGAAVHFVQPDGSADTMLVNPNGEGYTNTINRAELSAIHQALHAADTGDSLHLYTDSLCSIHLIRRMLDSPWTLTECKHEKMLQSIVEILRQRAEAGATTHMHKVRSHVGIMGNEKADEAAKLAAQDPTSDRLVKEWTQKNPYKSRAWVKAQGGQDGNPRYVTSLTKGIKDAVKGKASAGQFAKAGIYASAWEDALPTLDKGVSCHMFADAAVTWKQVTLTMKARWGQLWNRKLAHRYGMAASDSCPMCGQADSVGHMLGGCSHPHPQALRIARHDGAVRMLQTAISKGNMAGAFTVMDAGTQASLPDGVHGKRLPAWLLPGIADAERVKMRPDLLVAQGLTAADMRELNAGELPLEHVKHRIHIHVFELGYCGDTSYASKDEVKRAQHERLVAELRTRGIKVHYHVVLLGRCGTMQTETRRMLQDVLGMDRGTAETCMQKLHRHAVQYVEKFYTARQLIDNPAPGGTAGPNRNPITRNRRHVKARRTIPRQPG